jgi:hypothetical protein
VTSNPVSALLRAQQSHPESSRSPGVSDPLGIMSDSATVRLAGDIAAMPPSEPILQGFLRKEGASSGSWKKRWFVLWRDRLDYMKRQDSGEPQGSIAVASMRSVAVDSAAYPQPHSFQLSTPARVYAFQAPLEAAQRHWLSAIAAVMLLATGAHPPLGSTVDGAADVLRRPPTSDRPGPAVAQADDAPEPGAARPGGASHTGRAVEAALEALDRLSAQAAEKKREVGVDAGGPHKANVPASRPDLRDGGPSSSWIHGQQALTSSRSGARSSRAPSLDQLPPLPPSFESGEVSMLTGHPGFAVKEMGGNGGLRDNSSSDEAESSRSILRKV